MPLAQHKPAVPRRWLLGLAGILWLLVGTVLCVRAGIWLAPQPPHLLVLGAAVALGAGLAVGRHGLSRVARRNIGRIGEAPDRACVFSFQAWRGYLMIGVMVLLGSALRHSAVPRLYLAVLYAAMGVGLIWSSRLYLLSLRAAPPV
jgi:hypothetical protein